MWSNEPHRQTILCGQIHGSEKSFNLPESMFGDFVYETSQR